MKRRPAPLALAAMLRVAAALSIAWMPGCTCNASQEERPVGSVDEKPTPTSAPSCDRCKLIQQHLLNLDVSDQLARGASAVEVEQHRRVRESMTRQAVDECHQSRTGAYVDCVLAANDLRQAQRCDRDPSSRVLSANTTR